MTTPAVSTMTTQRIDRLLRSLVGVSDVRLLWRARKLRAVHILRASGTQPHQLIRNIVSGLHAGFGIAVLPTQVHIHDDTLVFEALEVAADVLTEPDPPATNGDAPARDASSNGHTHGNGGAKTAQANGDTLSTPLSSTPSNGSAHEPARAPRAPSRPQPAREPRNEETMVVRPSAAPAEIVAAAAGLLAQRRQPPETLGLTLERIDVERRGGTLRCRTVLALGDRMYSAIAEVPDSPSAEAELAARVAVDALRAGGLTTAMLDGVGFITIARTNYCVVTVREPGSTTPRASAAPLIDSMAASATAAVLTALGSFTDKRARTRSRAGH
jgi:hypothetical protein